MNNKIPRTLPDCKLLQMLAEKANHRHDIDFDFLGRLDQFRQQVSEEVRQINVLFPEYTPHDEQYHLKRLFHVADTVLGKDVLEAMNCTELFVLSVALYGHDCGMAVSDAEKQYIVTGKPPERMRPEDLWVLPDERRRFAEFARKQRLATDTKGCLEEISIEMWREYVRQTHAFRSGGRVRHFFEPIDGGVAEAASRVCEGHWLNFEGLRDARRYPPDFSVLRESVNLRALAIYLRLIDLLDLAEDRTPYVIWKFVAPRDPHSKMEWAKHRALRPVTCRPYMEGRVVQVDGSTDDNEVYAALEDLRIYCEEQLRGCNDLLARMNDPRHKLDLYHIDWRVLPQGFKEVLIQFEFDRERMFEILSDDIYQGDPYVFLRELLQNSIDAIRMRHEVLRRRGIVTENLGVIEVTVDHGDGGDAVVTWRDDGIGMDEYMVKNYFAVTGRSYYRSTDFEREGLSLDPISRFGIGILSCFIVADRIEIETFKDPYLSPSSEPLRITIPAMQRQFRVEVGTAEAAEVGTTVRVIVKGEKLTNDDKSGDVKPLDVTAYLSIIAGFVEFPIVITEGDSKTVILHPSQDAEAVRRRFGNGLQVHQIDLTYPWSEVILPQDLAIAREVFEEEYYDLSSDLECEGYEGALSYLVPSNDVIDVMDRGIRTSEGNPEVGIVMQSEAENASRHVRFAATWTSDVESEATGLSHSSRHFPTYTVYRDGILLPAASLPEAWPRRRNRPLPMPHLVVNLPKSEAPRVDLARTELVNQPRHWDAPIFLAHLRHLSATSLEALLPVDSTERYFELARLITFCGIDTEELYRSVLGKRWPLLLLGARGSLDISEWQDVAVSPICLVPKPLAYDVLQLLWCELIAQEQYGGPLIEWAGEKCIVSVAELRVWKGPDRNSAAIRMATDLWKVPVGGTHCLGAVRFLSPPWQGDPPLMQKIWLPIEVPEEVGEVGVVLQKAIEDPTALSTAEIGVLWEERKGGFLSRLPRAVAFPKPFEGCFTYGLELLNLEHRIVQALIRSAASLELAEIRRKLEEDQIGRFRDAFSLLRANYGYGVPVLFGELRFQGIEFRPLCDALRRIWALVREMRLVEIGEVDDLMPVPEDFVSGTYVPGSSGRDCAEQSTVGSPSFFDALSEERLPDPFGVQLG